MIAASADIGRFMTWLPFLRSTIKTWGWPELPSQTETKASDSMAQDCVRKRGVGVPRVSWCARGRALFGGALFASLAASYLNKRREYVYREASLPPPPKLGDGDISLRSEVFSQGSTLSVGGEKSTGLRTERA